VPSGTRSTNILGISAYYYDARRAWFVTAILSPSRCPYPFSVPFIRGASGLFLVALGALLVFAKGSALASFIYSLF
jgi:hypothetical protein